MRHRIGSARAGLLPSMVVAAGLLPPTLLLTAGTASAVESPLGWPAVSAHGALESPLSRAAACGAESPLKNVPAACRAAAAVNGSAMPADWDNLRVPDVAGRDRELIPDGKLCSGGLPAFKGLDLARADWPTTTLKPGARFAFRYRGTIPHRGTFRLYVTAGGYDPAKPLKWSDLGGKPFLKATDPKLADGTYVIKGRLPTGRTGRHLIYTVWQNSDTPDTYYSCSDVIFTAASTDDPANAPNDDQPSTAGDDQASASNEQAGTSSSDEQAGAASDEQAAVPDGGAAGDGEPGGYDDGATDAQPRSATLWVAGSSSRIWMIGAAAVLGAGAGVTIVLILRTARRRYR
ncbi:lytic polysaccharide monooxygenase auxiliary activity family 9 protein [Nonomuraea sp. NPDC002799]